MQILEDILILIVQSVKIPASIGGIKYFTTLTPLQTKLPPPIHHMLNILNHFLCLQNLKLTQNSRQFTVILFGVHDN